MKSIGDRMKHNYENRSRYYLNRRTPVILRIDGKCFHKYTKYFDKPFDETLSRSMVSAMKKLCKEIQGAKLAYQQSDEVSILITDFDTLSTEAWFDYNLQKISSVAASIFTGSFNFSIKIQSKLIIEEAAFFDCRVFNIPKEEVVNYFVWRQLDWERNSLQMLARSHFSHKECENKNSAQLHEMLHTVGKNWAKLDPKWKNGTTYFPEEKEEETALIFTHRRNVIETLLESKEI